MMMGRRNTERGGCIRINTSLIESVVKPDEITEEGLDVYFVTTKFMDDEGESIDLAFDVDDKGKVKNYLIIFEELLSDTDIKLVNKNLDKIVNEFEKGMVM